MFTKFDPNVAVFQDGVRRVEMALAKIKFRIGRRVITSQDKEAVRLANLLAVDNIPEGFKKWQLPFIMDRSQLYISVGNPDVMVPLHSHDEGDGIRFIMSGSVYFRDRELKSGDWMFIPRGTKYTMKIGPLGAVMCHCYCCCCAGKGLHKGRKVINPNPFR
ncbi:MAG TPA: cupin domain-containing protein [Chitinophagaceae bacterium]|nr:cupin domain-containing protein [Chitinophagaceae bacterium]